MPNGTDLTPKERRAGLAYAARLAALALNAPDSVTRGEAWKAVRAIESKYGYSPEEKRALIFALVCDGAASYAELIEESCLRSNDVYKAVAELKKDGKVTTQSKTTKRRGRPIVLIFPT